MKLGILSIGLVLLMAGSAEADDLLYESDIDGAQSATTCAPGSTARGVGTFHFDPGTNAFDWNITFGNNAPDYDDGLLQQGTENNAHIHVGAPGVDGGISVPLAGGTPKIGNTVLDAQQEADLSAGLFYVNIHSTGCGGGEIRGQVLVASPMPALPLWAYLASAAALLALALLARRRQLGDRL